MTPDEIELAKRQLNECPNVYVSLSKALAEIESLRAVVDAAKDWVTKCWQTDYDAGDDWGEAQDDAEEKLYLSVDALNAERTCQHEFRDYRNDGYPRCVRCGVMGQKVNAERSK